VERKRFAKFKTSQPPLHSNTFGARRNQGVQLADTLLDYISGLRTDGKPERGVIAPHVFHSFRTNRLHGKHQSSKKLIRQRVFEEIDFVHVLIASQTSETFGLSNKRQCHYSASLALQSAGANVTSTSNLTVT
jgi:hypothetical protein